MLGRNLHSGTSKTKELVPVQPDFPLSWNYSVPCDHIVQRTYSLVMAEEVKSKTSDEFRSKYWRISKRCLLLPLMYIGCHQSFGLRRAPRHHAVVLMLVTHFFIDKFYYTFSSLWFYNTLPLPLRHLLW